MPFTRNAILASALLTAAIAGCKSDESKDTAGSSEYLSTTRTASVTLTARVKAINYNTREITLEDNSGNATSFIVSNDVQRLGEVRVGDYVQSKYRVTLLAELRPPTADEMEAPIAIVATSGRTPKGHTPAAGSSTATRVVTTVEAVDVPNMLVTLKGPMGDVTVVRGQNPDNVKQIRVGDTIVITYTEAVGISLLEVPHD